MASGAGGGIADRLHLENVFSFMYSGLIRIGFSIARRLGLDGAKVVVSSRKQENVDRAVSRLEADNIDVFGQVCHAGNPEHRHRLIEETVKRNGGIDILVSSAGTNPHIGPMLEIFDVNVKSPFFLCKEVVTHMKGRGGGSIVLMSSIGGYIPFVQEILPYYVSKTAVLGLVKTLALQCAEMNIRVNGIAPGVIDTEFGNVLTADDSDRKRILSFVPLGRAGRPEECAGIVSFLASSDADYITGENIVIGGGAFSRL